MQRLLGKFSNLVSDHDQDHALVVGQGATAGLFQSIMLKPPNVVNIYPLQAAKRPLLNIPSEWKDTVVIFSVQNDRPDDLLTTAAAQADLRIQIADLLNLKIPVVVSASGTLLETLRQRFSDDPLVRFTNERNPVIETEAMKIWVGTCNQANIISAIEHKALMFGYFNSNMDS
jgi:hypothetical protein